LKKPVFLPEGMISWPFRLDQTGLACSSAGISSIIAEVIACWPAGPA